jgi:hypothetical protein
MVRSLHQILGLAAAAAAPQNLRGDIMANSLELHHMNESFTLGGDIEPLSVKTSAASGQHQLDVDIPGSFLGYLWAAGIAAGCRTWRER